MPSYAMRIILYTGGFSIQVLLFILTNKKKIPKTLFFFLFVAITCIITYIEKHAL